MSNSQNRDARFAEILTCLEDLELPLLSWGVVDASLAAEDVDNVLDPFVTADLAEYGPNGLDASELLQALLDRGLLHRVPGTDPPRYRTRIAEALRLVRHLRQLFPPANTSQEGWWRAGPPLVADFRLGVQPRMYPVRDVTIETITDRLELVDGWTTADEVALRGIVGQRKLARFQADATCAILEALGQPRSRAVVVGAGTGSGKTLAFYLPALADIARRLSSAPTSVHSLALYPRTELLRDQAREAMAATKLLSEQSVEGGGRPVRIGVLYGSTPKDAAAVTGKYTKWNAASIGFACPYFPCPEAGCSGQVCWTFDDHQNRVERLTCEVCGVSIEGDRIALTRQSLLRTPPDILFTTTEMVSRQATDTRLGRLIGWKGSSAPRLVLLDEIHTYLGVHGAQVALMLRRWRSEVASNGNADPMFVGLSATLDEPARFFSQLTGVPEHRTTAVEPRSAELRPTGREYTIALRSDPVSGASVLSTTIQVSMLFGRLLDDEPGTYGSSGFLFTDTLDVTNRLFDYLSDAEGSVNWRKGLYFTPVLAQLRSPDLPLAHARYLDGQSWDLPDELGRMARAGNYTGGRSGLSTGALRVGRTTSQDSGVDAASDLVVATSSLEVGFNDPRVGLVVQHKAPRDSASYIQRKGRAGRSPAMRPIAIVVLSDFGRDRIAYQQYDQLLRPAIGARSLPLRNRFVLKIQGTHALLDWLSRRMGNRVDLRRVLDPAYANSVVGRDVSLVVAQLSDLLRDGDSQDALEGHLQRALGIGIEDARAVLWDEPRSILLSVVPTILRRLRSNWKTLPDSPDPGASPQTLLPDFVTASLFSPLNTPEVTLRMPLDIASEYEDSAMGVDFALREAVSGRVSRRLGHRFKTHRTWLPIPDGDSLELREVVVLGERQGDWAPHDGPILSVVRPFSLQLASPPPEIADQTNAFPRWHSQFIDLPVETGASQDQAPATSALAPVELSREVHFCTHDAGTQILVRRMTSGANIDLVTKVGGRSVRSSRAVDYVVDGEAAALGFELEVDAAVFRFATPSAPTSARDAYLDSAGWRSIAFETRVVEDPKLAEIASKFDCLWVTRVFIAAVAMEVAGGGDVVAAVNALRGGAWQSRIREFFAATYRTAEESDSPENLGRVVARIDELASHPTVIEVVDRHANLLVVGNVAESTGDLYQRAYRDTMAGALRAAVAQLVPDSGDQDLVADVEMHGEGFNVIVSETSIGGLGVIEKLREIYQMDSGSFWRALSNTLGPTAMERAAEATIAALRELNADSASSFGAAVSRFRAAQDSKESELALADVLEAWDLFNGVPDHGEVSAFVSRFLRPGADPDIDARGYQIYQSWIELENRAHLELDASLIAFLVDRGQIATGGHRALNADEVFSLLMPRGLLARKSVVDHWNPYRTGLLLDRMVVAATHELDVPQVQFSDEWLDEARGYLESQGVVDVTAPMAERVAIGHAIGDVLTVPIDRYFMRLFPIIQSVRRDRGKLTIRLSVEWGGA